MTRTSDWMRVVNAVPDVGPMAEAVRDVVKKHRPRPGAIVCDECPHPWPCPTVREVADRFGVTL